MEHGRRHAMLFKEDLTIQLKKHVHIIEKAYLSDNRETNIYKSLPTRWRPKKPAGIDIERHYVTVTQRLFRALQVFAAFLID